MWRISLYPNDILWIISTCDEDFTLSKWHSMEIKSDTLMMESISGHTGHWAHWSVKCFKDPAAVKKNKLKPIEFYNIVPTLNLRLSRQIDENDRKGEEPVEKKATHLVLPHVLLFGHKKSEKKSLPFIADLLVISRQAKRGPPIFFFFFCFPPCAWGGWKCKAAPLSDAISFRRN